MSGAEDDVALLALRSVPLAPERMELTLPAEPLELGSLRRALRALAGRVRGERAESYDIVLACNEACANAIEHAYGPGDASVQVDAALSGARSRSRSATTAAGATRAATTAGAAWA